MSTRPRGTGALEVRRTKAGQDVLYARFRVAGQQQRHRVGVLRKPGSAVGITRREAESELRTLLATAATKPERERLTVQQACERYIADREIECKRGTLVSYESIARKRVYPYFRGKSLDGVDDGLIERWRDYLLEDVSPKTATNVMIFLSGVFRYAVRKKLIETSPFEGVTRPRNRRGKEIRFLTNAELEKLLHHVPDDPWGRLDTAAILTAAQTGPRQGELLALRWRDIDWSASVIRIRRSYGHGEFSTPKSQRSSRATPMNQRVARELELVFQASRWQGDDDLVFAHPDTGRVQDASKLRKRYRTYREPAGLIRPGIDWHSLRHTFGTSMAASGAPMRMLQQWMGHASITTTEIYADYSPDPSQGVVFAERAFGGTPMAQQELAAAI